MAGYRSCFAASLSFLTFEPSLRSVGRSGRRLSPTASVAATLLFVLMLSMSARAAFKAVIEADLDGDGRVERIDLDSDRGVALQVSRDGKLLWSGVSGSWKPWKMQLADVDGDGKPEIVVGVFKSTKFFPKPHNCLFIYGWSGEQAYSKWLGSSLGRPFTDFLFADLDNKPGDELVAIETTLERKAGVAVYRWNSFGFTLDRRQGEWGSVKLLSADGGRISIKADGRIVFIPVE